MGALSRYSLTGRIGVLATSALICSNIGMGADQADLTFRTPGVQAESPIEAGRYIVTIGGCHDCHTHGWAETNGEVPESNFLTGSPIGWRGPWGTTYASNLRIVVDGMTEDAWVAMLRHRADRPPMPWMNVARMSEADSRAVYRYIRSLGVAGERMPAYVAPATEPTTPYFLLQPTGPNSVTAITTAANEDSR